MLLTFFSFTPIFKTQAFENQYTTNASVAESSSDRFNFEESAEDSDVFGFIKDNKNVKDFFYDGSALLYGGILLIIISVFGIFKTLKPKKNKKRRRKSEFTNHQTK